MPNPKTERETVTFVAPTGLRPVSRSPSPRISEASVSKTSAQPDVLASLQASLPGIEARLAKLEVLLEQRLKNPPDVFESAKFIADTVSSTLQERFKSLERRVDAAIARGSNGASSPFFPNDHEVKEDSSIQPKALRDVSVGSGTCGISAAPIRKPGTGFLTRRSASLLEEDTVPRLRRISKEATGKDWFLRRGFVVNFRRLMELQKVFAIIHELIKSTAIAALTLVLASDVWQLGYSVMFVVILFMIYGFHAAHYDTMDISDYQNLVELLEDDNGVCGGRNVDNPNRLLKALSLKRPGRRRRALFINVLFGLLCSGMWSMVIYSWTMELQESGIWQIGGEFYATLLLVGTLMLIFHSIFEWLYWRETQCVMPYWNRARKVPWDPVVHGIPHRFRWLGLPSMWFTSSESYADLSLWIHHAKGHEFGRKANKVFPEEMALFSLYARNACQLRRSLRHAKLYNVHKASFLTRGDDAKSKCQRLQSLPTGSEPEELQIDFMFYDILSKEYLQPEEDYTDTQIHVLQHAPPTWPEGDRGATLLQQYQWKLHQASI